MKNSPGCSKIQAWSIAIPLLVSLLAGCGGGGDDSDGAQAQASANIAAAALAAGRTLTVGVGAGTGVGGTGLGPAPVNLLSIATNNFAILSKTGITNGGGHITSITGNIGSSPISGTAMNNVFCSEMTGASKIFSVDDAYVGSGAVGCFVPGPPTGPASNKTLIDNAILDVGTAFADAAARAPDYTELGAGAIGGMTLPPAVYKWGTGVTILTDLFLVGGPNDVWIFQISGDVTMASAKNITILGGGLAKNIFWQINGPTGVALNTTAHFEGTILASKAITVNTGATLNGRFLSQTTVTLLANTVVVPAP